MEFNFWVDSIIKLMVSALCGVLLGFERQKHNKVIGMRTLFLISVSATLLSILSCYMSELNEGSKVFTGDSTRIAAGVISGIGFLGGGAIMKTGLNIKGLTSAAIIWMAASLGLAIGSGLYVPVAFTLFLCLGLLKFLESIELKFFPASREKTLQLFFEKDDVNLEDVRKVLESHGIHVLDANESRVVRTSQIIIRYSVKTPANVEYSGIVEQLKTLGSLSEFSVLDS